MRTQLPSWWRKRKRLLITITIVMIGVLLFALLVHWFGWDWTGFKGKTLWDWLGLLGVLAIPVVVGLGAAWYTAQQGKVSERENTDNQRQTALQAYIDKMLELLQKLRDSAEDDEVRYSAQVRTLTVLTDLDGKRKRDVLLLLFNAGLIDRNSQIIDISDADLSEADLSEVILWRREWIRDSSHEIKSNKTVNADLSRVNLRNANLNGADLSDAKLGIEVENEFMFRLESDIAWHTKRTIAANLSGADLREAILYNTVLGGVDLQGSDLSGAKLGGASLQYADLSGANLQYADLSIEDFIQPGYLARRRKVHGLELLEWS